jgi:TolA-binding protein
MKNLRYLLPLLVLAGCALQTRYDKDKETKVSTVTPQQEAKANTDLRLQEVDNQFRDVNGRIESLEHEIANLKKSHLQGVGDETKKRDEFDVRLKAYEQSLEKLEKQVALLAEENTVLKGSGAAKADLGTTAGKDAKQKGKELYDEAEQDFDAKNWKQAIVGFQKYRDANPKGKQYAEATYKIGVSFQELSMKTEARAFFEELIEKFPKSRSAEKAKLRLKSLKK